MNGITTENDVEVYPSGRRGIKRLIRGNTIVGTLTQTDDKRWRIYGADRYLLTKDTFPDLKKARDAFVRLEGSPPASPEQLPEPVTIENAGVRHAKRLVRGGEIVAMLLQMTSGRWGVYDTQEKPILSGRYSTPGRARDAFVDWEGRQSSSASE